MKKRISAIAAVLSLMPLGQPLVIGTSAVLTSAAVMLSVPEKVKAENAEFYFKRAFKKGEVGDSYGAISDYNKAIEINPKYYDAYINRGNQKKALKDYEGAIKDFNRAIIINPDDSFAYYNRARAKWFLKDNYGAISDFNKVISIDPNNPRILDVYSNLGVAKEGIGDMKGACTDWRKASSLGDKESAKWVKEDC